MFILPLVLSVILIILDQVSKNIAVTNLYPDKSVKFIDGLIHFQYVENTGAAFGLFQGARWIFLIITIPLLVCVVYYYFKMPKSKVSGLTRISLILIFSGAIGNMIDRLFNGFVVDFLEFGFISFPVFNFADIYVVCGTVLLGILVIFFMDDNKKENEKASDVE